VLDLLVHHHGDAIGDSVSCSFSVAAGRRSARSVARAHSASMVSHIARKSSAVVWPHGDYPLIEVGRMTLDRNPTDYHTQIEQAAFEPNNLIPGIALSPDKMLLARGFAYADAHRARMGVNYKQIPVNAPKVPVHSYSKDGTMRIALARDPVYAPNSKGGPEADTEHYGQPASWYTEGDLMRSAYSLHDQDDDWGQAGTMVREVLDDAARDRLVSNIAGHLLDGVTEPVQHRAFEYWRNVDKNLGDRIEASVRAL
jgi:catalase